MVRPTQIAVLLIAACLTGCGGYAMFDPDMSTGYTQSAKQVSWLKGSDPSQTADSTGSTSGGDASNAGALNSLFSRAAESKAEAPPPAAKPVVVADAAESDVTPKPAATAEKVEPRGRAYLFRGVAGLIYSRGIDGLADRIRRAGISASVDTYLVWRPVAEQAVRDYRRDPEPITLIGHSMGGDAAVDFAEMLNAANIPVNLLVTYDPTRIADDVPPNVERYINIYQSSNFMGGGNVVQASRFHGHYASYNLKDHNEIVHINIEKADRIQEQIATKVAQLAGTPSGVQGEPVPMHLQVPADAAIELWDSGLAVSAHAGDTLKTLAATYHVPTWSLAQINALSDRTPLGEGQRIVVPRHLVPMPVPSTVTSYAPVGR